MKRLTPNITPFRIQKFLSGARYPARTGELIERAIANGADEAVVRALRTLPERSFASPVALARELGAPAR